MSARVVVPSSRVVAEQLHAAACWMARQDTRPVMSTGEAVALVDAAGTACVVSPAAASTLAAIASAVPHVAPPPRGWSRVALAAVVAEAARRATPTPTGGPGGTESGAGASGMPFGVPALAALVAALIALVGVGWFVWAAVSWVSGHGVQVVAVLVGVGLLTPWPAPGRVRS